MTSRATPFQRDVDKMVDALQIERPRIGAADEALVRRIVCPDPDRGEGVNVHNSATADPAGSEAVRRVDSQEQREIYRDAVNEVWKAIKALRRETDDVLRNEPLLPHGATVCSTRQGTPTACSNFASPHTKPDGQKVEDLCDGCWWNLCPRCYVRPTAEYRPTCFTCYQRELREQRRHGNEPEENDVA